MKKIRGKEEDTLFFFFFAITNSFYNKGQLSYAFVFGMEITALLDDL